MSSIAMAAALANLVILTTMVSGNRLAGILTALMFSVLHTPWWLATITETYTCNLALFTTELILLVMFIKKPMCGTAFFLMLVNGLNWSIHNLALLCFPVYVILLIVLIKQKKLTARALPAALAAFILGASPYLFLIVKSTLTTGGWIDAFHSALFGKYASDVLNTGSKWRYLKANAGLASLNFMNLILPLALAGWLNMKKRAGIMLTCVFIIITLIELIFFIRYSVPDQFTFILPSLVMISIAVSVAISHLLEKSKKWKTITLALCLLSFLLQPAIYAAVPGIINSAGIKIKRARKRPFRDELKYWLIPWKNNENSAEKFAAAALKKAMPDGILICDSTTLYPLLVAQQRDRFSPDVKVLSSGTIIDNKAHADIFKNRAIFTVLPSLNLLPSEIRGHAVLNPDGVLWKVSLKNQTNSRN